MKMSLTWGALYSCYDTKTNNHTMFVDAKGVTQTFFQRQAKD